MLNSDFVKLNCWITIPLCPVECAYLPQKEFEFPSIINTLISFLNFNSAKLSFRM